MEELLSVVDRKNEVRDSQPTQVIKQRLAVAADTLNRVGALAIHVEVANEALCKLVYVLYQKEVDGSLANVDTRTHRLLIPVPWGDRGWKRWGLRHWEAVVLRGIMLDRLTNKKRPSLFDYNTDTRTWYLNLVDYGVFDAAQHYLTRSPITVAEWRKVTDRLHGIDLERKRKSSGR